MAKSECPHSIQDHYIKDGVLHCAECEEEPLLTPAEAATDVATEPDDQE